MSKQEIYAWVSLASTLAILGLYVLNVWGLPEGMEGAAAGMIDLFFKVIVIAFVVELGLGISKQTAAGRIDKDERDIQIEGKGFRNAYYVVMAGISLAAAQLFIGNLMGEEIAESVLFVSPSVILHVLVILFLGSSLVKAGTQLYYYRLSI